SASGPIRTGPWLSMLPLIFPRTINPPHLSETVTLALPFFSTVTTPQVAISRRGSYFLIEMSLSLGGLGQTLQGRLIAGRRPSCGLPRYRRVMVCGSWGGLGVVGGGIGIVVSAQWLMASFGAVFHPGH